MRNLFTLRLGRSLFGSNRSRRNDRTRTDYRLSNKPVIRSFDHEITEPFSQRERRLALIAIIAIVIAIIALASHVDTRHGKIPDRTITNPSKATANKQGKLTVRKMSASEYKETAFAHEK